MRNANTIAAIVLVVFAAGLTGCGDKAAEEAAARKKAEDEAAKVVLKQGNGTVRKWGQSGFVDVSKVTSPAPAPAPASGAQNAQPSGQKGN